MKAVLSLVLSIIASPALAGETLWSNITLGMSVDQLRALYPGAEYKSDKAIVRYMEVMPKCRAKLIVFYKSGSVTSVWLEGKPTIFDTCPSQIMEALKGKYGAPDEIKLTEGRAKQFGLNDDLLTWRRGNLWVKYQSLESNAMNGASWRMTYEPVQEVSL